MKKPNPWGKFSIKSKSDEQRIRWERNRKSIYSGEAQRGMISNIVGIKGLRTKIIMSNETLAEM